MRLKQQLTLVSSPSVSTIDNLSLFASDFSSVSSSSPSPKTSSDSSSSSSSSSNSGSTSACTYPATAIPVCTSKRCRSCIRTGIHTSTRENHNNRSSLTSHREGLKPSYIILDQDISLPEALGILGRVVGNVKSPLLEYSPSQSLPDAFIPGLDPACASHFSSLDSVIHGESTSNVEQHGSKLVFANLPLTVSSSKTATFTHQSRYSRNTDSLLTALLGISISASTTHVKTFRLESRLIRTISLTQLNSVWTALLKTYKKEITTAVRRNGGKMFLVVGVKVARDAQVEESVQSGKGVVGRVTVDVGGGVGIRGFGRIEKITGGEVEGEFGTPMTVGLAGRQERCVGDETEHRGTLLGDRVFAVEYREVRLKVKLEMGSLREGKKQNTTRGVSGIEFGSQDSHIEILQKLDQFRTQYQAKNPTQQKQPDDIGVIQKQEQYQQIPLARVSRPIRHPLNPALSNHPTGCQLDGEEITPRLPSLLPHQRAPEFVSTRTRNNTDLENAHEDPEQLYPFMEDNESDQDIGFGFESPPQESGTPLADESDTEMGFGLIVPMGRGSPPGGKTKITSGSDAFKDNGPVQVSSDRVEEKQLLSDIVIGVTRAEIFSKGATGDGDPENITGKGLINTDCIPGLPPPPPPPPSRPSSDLGYQYPSGIPYKAEPRRDQEAFWTAWRLYEKWLNLRRKQISAQLVSARNKEEKRKAKEQRRESERRMQEERLVKLRREEEERIAEERAAQELATTGGKREGRVLYECGFLDCEGLPQDLTWKRIDRARDREMFWEEVRKLRSEMLVEQGKRRVVEKEEEGEDGSDDGYELELGDEVHVQEMDSLW